MENDKVKDTGSPDVDQAGKEVENPDEPKDDNISYYPPQTLESLRNVGMFCQPGGDYATRRGYEHLRDVVFDLENLKLTNKQLIAVSLVFYGNVRKYRAARVMNITEQALEDHVRAALRKIEKNLCGS